MKDTLIKLAALVLTLSSVSLADVTVKEVGALGNDYDFVDNFLKFYDDDAFITQYSFFDGESSKLPFELNSAINGATFLDRNNAGEILGTVPNLSTSDTLSVFVWSPTSGVREVFSFSTSAGATAIYILGGGLSENGTVKLLYANEYIQKDLPVKLLVSKVGQSVQQFSFQAGLNATCDGATCTGNFSHKVLGLGNDNSLYIEVSPFGFKNTYAAFSDEGQLRTVTSDYVPSYTRSVQTTDKNLTRTQFESGSVDVLLTSSNTLKVIDSPKSSAHTDVQRVNDVSQTAGTVGDYFQRFHTQSSKNSVPWSLDRWGYLVKPGSAKFERIECKLKPSLMKNLNLVSALKINSSGNILANFRKGNFSVSGQKSAILSGYSSTNANYCPTASIRVGSECKSIFSLGSNGTRLSTRQKFKGKSKKCSFSIQTKLGKTPVTDGSFLLSGVGASEKVISCKNGVCPFSITLNSDTGRYFVRGPQNSKRARSTVKFLITNGE